MTVTGRDMAADAPGMPADWPIRVVEIEGKGRGVLAARDIHAGEVISVEAPTTVVPGREDDGSLVAACSRCLVQLQDGGLRASACGGCAAVRCCTPECLALYHRELHTPAVCASLSALKRLGEKQTLTPEDVEGATLLLMFHALRAGTAGPYGSAEGALAESSGVVVDGRDAYRMMQLLCDDASCVDAERQQQFAAAYRAYCAASPAEGRFTEQEAADVLRKDMQNGFVGSTTVDGEIKLKGSCLLLRSSMYNHDCYPNAARIDYMDDKGCEAFSGAYPSCSTMVRAIQSIPEGTEVCISYTSITFSSSERAEYLGETYGIPPCKCDRCKCEDQMEEEQQDGESLEEGQGGGLEDMLDEELERQHDHGHGDGGGCHGDGCHNQCCDDDEAPSAIAMYNVFVTRFICPQEGCTGTLVPVRNAEGCSRRSRLGDAPGELRDGMECNTCYCLRTEEEFEARLMGDDCEDMEE